VLLIIGWDAHPVDVIRRLEGEVDAEIPTSIEKKMIRTSHEYTKTKCGGAGLALNNVDVGMRTSGPPTSRQMVMYVHAVYSLSGEQCAVFACGYRRPME